MPVPPELATTLAELRAGAKQDLEANRIDDFMTKTERLRQTLELAARATVGATAGGPRDDDLVPALRASLARDVSEADVRLADELLAEATTLQWQIGSWASGPGEGRYSMHLVRTLQLARAHLLARGDEAARDEARRLLAEAESDRSGLDPKLARHAAALGAALG